MNGRSLAKLAERNSRGFYKIVSILVICNSSPSAVRNTLSFNLYSSSGLLKALYAVELMHQNLIRKRFNGGGVKDFF